IGFVRWTEQRNFEAVLDMMTEGRLDVKSLISHRFPIDDAEEAYSLVGGATRSLGILLQYPTLEQKPEMELRRQTVVLTAAAQSVGPPRTPTVGFIGSGSYATSTLIRAFKETGVRLKTVASSGGTSGLYAARKFGFE